MELFKAIDLLKKYSYGIILISIWLFSLWIRFWKIEQFNQLVFDEIYYAKFANNYLIGKPVFDAHPPLSQYIIAFGIWLSQFFPISSDITNDLTGTTLSPFSYRWMNSFTGSFIPLILGGIAYQITRRHSYSLIVAGLMALDGFFIVESRYALKNIYLVFFGLLSHFFFLWALSPNKKPFKIPILNRFPFWLNPIDKLALCGFFLGSCVSIKWNGIGFFVPIYVIIISIYIYQWLSKKFKLKSDDIYKSFLVEKLLKINPLYLILFLVIIPIITYFVWWIPHLIINQQMGFFEVHKQIFKFHKDLGGKIDIHPYCSRWNTWLWMERPIAYYYREIIENGKKIIYDVHAMGNPILWWLSTASLVPFTIFFTTVTIRFCQNKLKSPHQFLFVCYLFSGYSANFLPWAKISRCTFLYHYMGALVFAIMILGWLLDNWLRSEVTFFRQLAISLIILIIISFLFWLPFYLGLPLLPYEYKIRIWSRSWI
jgi:dolichyl-phosphate-mannose-protein mannosyltransferase